MRGGQDGESNIVVYQVHFLRADQFARRVYVYFAHHTVVSAEEMRESVSIQQRIEIGAPLLQQLMYDVIKLVASRGQGLPIGNDHLIPRTLCPCKPGRDELVLKEFRAKVEKRGVMQFTEGEII